MNLQFKSIDVEQHSAWCIQFAEDTELCSFGAVDGFREEDLRGRERFIERIKLKLSQDTASCVHVWKDGDIIGQIHLGQFSEPTVGYLNFFYVVPAWRGRGVAKIMETYVTTWLEQRDFKSALLSVTMFNERAFRFYKRCGWEDLGPREDRPNIHNMRKILD